MRRAVQEFDVSYPVALDNNYAIWQAFNNRYWPAHYFIDAQGRIRGHHFGEGEYRQSELLIRSLLEEAGHKDLPPLSTDIQAEGIEVAADDANVQSPETYVGYDRAENFASPGGFSRGQARMYTAPAGLTLNQWALSGTWQVESERAQLQSAPGRITFRFQARDLHLVLGPGKDGKPVRFRITIDGREPGKDHGTDTDAAGAGSVSEQRLYQLIRQSDGAQQHTFDIEFLDPGVRAYAFTFG